MADPEQSLIELAAEMTHDPLRFVRAFFPWGEPGDLADKEGPREWQAEALHEIGAHLRNPETRHRPLRLGVASGHGVGKSALVSWLVTWAMATMPDCKVIVTANTEPQLRTKTWPELTKWHRLSLCSHWFDCTATAMSSRDPKRNKTWRADAIPWNEQRTESFAGLHNAGRRILVVFDEASAIPDKIWEVVEGALTDEGTEILWVAFGNPTRNTGRFREAFGRLAHRWVHKQVDSRDVDGTDKKQIAEWQTDYGDDSDFFRVRVRGLFPRAGSMQFIAGDLVDRAMHAESHCELVDPLVMGVDVARFGSDASVIKCRRGLDARTIPAIKLRGADTMALVGRVTEECRRLAAMGPALAVRRIFVDETGVGAGVVDRLRELGYPVTGVNNGASADGDVGGELCANKAAEQWARGRKWMGQGGAIEDDPDLRTQLEGREYGYDIHGRIKLESKDDMRKRGLSSPDDADALFLTFAYPVHPDPSPSHHAAQHQAVTDFDPFRA